MARSLRLVCLLMFVAATGCGGGSTPPAPEPQDNLDAGPLDAGRPDGGTPDGGHCPNPCGEECCTEDQDCVDGHCACRPQCEDRQCGPNGCGGTCGTCQEHQRCDETSGHCECVAETDTELCAAAPAECGALTVQDRCGQLREDLDCGQCTAPQQCEANHCVCHPESTAEFCSSATIDRQCGPASGQNRCGDPQTVDCGLCTEPPLCDTRVGRCVSCLPEPEAAWCQAHDRDCGTVHALDQCGAPEVFNCGACHGPQQCGANNICAAPGEVTNDSCARPEVVLFDALDQAVLEVDTSLGLNDGNGSCDTSTGKDLVYRVDVPRPSDLTVVAAPTGAGVLPNLYLRRSCADPATERMCVSAGSTSAPLTLVAESLAAGTYFLWVDAASSTGHGAQTVTLALTAPQPVPGNDLLAGATPLTFIDGVASTPGTTRGAFDDSTGTCATMNGGDVVYQFHLDEESAVLAKVTRDEATSASYAPAVYIVSAAGTTLTELGCGSAGTSTTTKGIASAFTSALLAGDYYIVVDGTAGSRGDFLLEATLGSPVWNDTCALPTALTFDTRKVATVSGDTSLGTDTIVSSCNGTLTGTDLVYSFEIPAGDPQNVLVVVTPAPGSALKPNPSVRRVCGDKATELGCVAISGTVGPASLRLKGAAPGLYYLWVDGWIAGSNGPFDLTVSLFDIPPAPPNDACPLAQVLARSSTAPGTTQGAAHDSTGSCGSMTGGDVVYTFHLDAPSAVTATITRSATTPDWVPAAYITTGCTGATEVACAQASGTDPVVAASAPALPAGDYYLHVDGLRATDGDFEVQLAVEPPQTNDSCVSPAAIVFDPSWHAVYRGRTVGMALDARSNSCGGSGPDAVYAFSVSARKNVRFRLTPGGFSGDSVLYVRGACNDEMSERRCHQASGSAVNELLVSGLTVGVTYYLWVDSYSSTGGGAYTLEIDALDPMPPANDACSGALALSVDPATESTVTVQGSTTDAAASGTGSCRTDVVDPSGPDVVYVFSLTSELRVEIAATPTAGSPLKPVLYVQSGACGTGPELACRAVSAANTAASVVLPHAAPGTYYVWVDGYAPEAKGDFSLTVTTTLPQAAPGNDSCRQPQPLTWDSTTQTFSATGTTLEARDDYQGSCASAAPQFGGDVVYELTPIADRSATVTVTRSSGTTNATFVPAVYLRSVCDSARAVDALGCAVGGPSTASFNVPFLGAAQTYYLVVDGAYGSAGDFTVQIQTRDPVNDTCALAAPLTLATGIPLQVSGSTVYAADDAGNLGCVGNGLTGRDVVYVFSTSALDRQKLTATLTYQTSTYAYPAMSLRRVCETTSPSDEVTCARKQSSGPLTMNANLDPGTYYLWVDVADTTDKGAFTLDLLLEDLLQAPDNDSCRAAESLGTLVAGVPVSRTLSTVAATNDYSRSCDGVATDGPDVVYGFHLDQEAKVAASVARDGASTTYSPAVYIRQACESTLAADQIACATSTSASAARATAWRLSAGDYFIIVDGRSGSGGGSTLTVTAAAPVAYPDSCRWAQPLNLGINGHVQITGDTTDAAADAAPPACDGSTSTVSGPDLVYVLDTAGLGARSLTAALQFDEPSNYPEIYLRRVCDSEAPGDQVRCVRRNASGGALALNEPNLAPGVYYLWVDVNFATDRGRFTLTVDLAAPVLAPDNSACATAQTLSLATGIARVSDATTILGGDDSAITCGTKQTNGEDVFYAFTLDQPASVWAGVARTAYSPTFEPSVTIRRYCAPTGADEFGCAVHTSGVASLGATLPAGSYYLVVDGTNGTSGRFDLELAVLTNSTSDKCISAEAFPLDGHGHGTLRANTSNATADDYSNCNTNSGNSYGKDLVYFVEVPAGTTKNLIVQAKPLMGSAYRPSIWVRSACATRSTELGCAYNGSANTATSFKILRLAEGTYYIWIDAYTYFNSGSPPTYGGYNGAFETTVDLMDPPPPPPNDTCAGAQALTFTGNKASVVGEVIEDALDSGSGTCGNMTGSDRVYQITLSQPQALYAFVRPSAELFPVIYVRKNICDSTVPSDEVLCKSNLSALKGYPLSAGLRNLGPGTYYLWVDTLSTQRMGTYSLEVILEAPQDNETCAGTIPALTPGVPVTGTVEGGTHDFADALSAACGSYQSKGNEVIYSYTPASDGPFQVKLTSHGYDLYIWMSRDTCGSPCIAYNDSGTGWEMGTTLGVDTLNYASGVAGTTYYLVVQNRIATSANNVGGAFTLVVN